MHTGLTLRSWHLSVVARHFIEARQAKACVWRHMVVGNTSDQEVACHVLAPLCLMHQPACCASGCKVAKVALLCLQMRLRWLQLLQLLRLEGPDGLQAWPLVWRQVGYLVRFHWLCSAQSLRGAHTGQQDTEHVIDSDSCNILPSTYLKVLTG